MARRQCWSFVGLPSTSIIALLVIVTQHVVFSGETDAKIKSSFDTTEKTLVLMKDVKEFVDNRKAETAKKIIKDLKGLGSTVKSGKSAGPLSVILKGISGVSRLASTFGLLGSVVSLIVAFIPQDDEMKIYFKEVNRKLDLISLKITSLQTEVQWANYASIYSQDESKIENSWAKFLEFVDSIAALKDTDEAALNQKKMRLAERFTVFYENTATESSVASFHRYLTEDKPSLRINLLHLLVERFTGNLTAVVEYSQHFNAVLLKGLQMNVYYYQLKGFNTAAMSLQSAEKLVSAVNAQLQAVKRCADMKWVQQEVENLAKTSTSKDKELAEQIKKLLDNKFFWNDWVIIILNKYYESSFGFTNFRLIMLGEKIIAVGYRGRGDEIDNIEEEKYKVKKIHESHYKNKQCNFMPFQYDLKNVAGSLNYYSSYEDKFYQTVSSSQVKASQRHSSGAGRLSSSYTCSTIYFLKSQSQIDLQPCSNTHCGKGKCVEIVGSATFCVCDKGFYGETCNKSVEDSLNIEKHNELAKPVPDLTTLLHKILNLKKH